MDSFKLMWNLLNNHRVQYHSLIGLVQSSYIFIEARTNADLCTAPKGNQVRNNMQPKRMRLKLITFCSERVILKIDSDALFVRKENERKTDGKHKLIASH